MITEVKILITDHLYTVKSPNTLLKCWVDKIGGVKVKERLNDTSVRVVNLNIVHAHDERFSGYQTDNFVRIDQEGSKWTAFLPYTHTESIEKEINIEVSDYTNPTFIYVADGETATVEPVTYTPSWLPPKPAIADFQAKLYRQICATAQHLNEISVHERAHRKIKLNELCLDIPHPSTITDAAERRKAQNVIDEVDNTVNHFRAWIGATWWHVKGLTEDSLDSDRLAAIERVLLLKAELPNSQAIVRFQDRHSPSAWKPLLAQRKLYKSRKAQSRGKLAIKHGDVHGATYTKVQWAKILLDHYNEAREHCHDLPEEEPEF